MLVTPSRLHCVRYKLEFDKQMRKMGLRYGCLVAFSGTVHDTDNGQGLHGRRNECVATERFDCG